MLPWPDLTTAEWERKLAQVRKTRTRESNDCHNPPGDGGGQFCTTETGSRYSRGLAPDKTGRVADGERLPEYKAHALAILDKATQPLSRHAMVEQLKRAGFKSKRTMAGGYEDRRLGLQRALEQLRAEGKVTVTTGEYGEDLWSRRT
jgi:hypothetical protein